MAVDTAELIGRVGSLRSAVQRLRDALKGGTIDTALLTLVQAHLTEPFMAEPRVRDVVRRIGDLEENSGGTMRETLEEAVRDADDLLASMDHLLWELAQDPMWKA